MKNIESMNVSFYFGNNDDNTGFEGFMDELEEKAIDVMAEDIVEKIFNKASDEEIAKDIEKSKEILDRIRRKRHSGRYKWEDQDDEKVIDIMSDDLVAKILNGAPDDEVIKRVKKSKEILDLITRNKHFDKDDKKVAEVFQVLVACLNKYGWVNICCGENNATAEDIEAVIKAIEHLVDMMTIGEYKSGSTWFIYTDRVDKDYILRYVYGIRNDTYLNKVYGFEGDPDDIDIYKAYYEHPDWDLKTLCEYIEKELGLYTNPGSLVHSVVMAPYILWKHGISPKDCKTITDACNLLIKRRGYFGSKRKKHIDNDINILRQLSPRTRCGSTFNILVQHMCNAYMKREDETSRGMISMYSLSSLNDCLFIDDDEFVILTLMYDICSYGSWNGKGLFNNVIRSLNDTILRISYNDNEEIRRFCDEVNASI